MTTFSTSRVDGLVWYLVQQWDGLYETETTKENPEWVFVIRRPYKKKIFFLSLDQSISV